MKFHSILCFLLILSLLFAGSVSAQAPAAEFSASPDNAFFTSLPRANQSLEVSALPNVALGQPGTVYDLQRVYGEAITPTPYLVDGYHLNGPNTLAFDASNSLYVVEELGNRLLKYNPNGANTLTLGQAGRPMHHDRFLSVPRGVAIDHSYNIWVTIDNAIKVFNSAGDPILMFPNDDPWNSAQDNSHFNEPRGIAFDAAGHLFVADRRNHRVQVYGVSGNSLTYQTTIGVTGEPGGDNAHFNGPAEIAIDPSGRLYVADVENFRVQRCTFAVTWTCSTFHGTGSAGNGNAQLNWAFGLGINAAGDRITIADSANGRIKTCTSSGTCTALATGLRWPADVAEDSAGNIYVSDYYDSTVRKYSSSGAFLAIFAGVSNTPYLTDGKHFNSPWGSDVGPDGSIYLTEAKGYRLIKLDAAGTMQWAVGQAGVSGSDNAHFGNFGGGPAGVAIESNGNILVADPANHRVQIFSAQGIYIATLGGEGTGNYQFSWPTDVATDGMDNLYVADCGNHRVQIYDSNRVYSATIGITGNSGSSDSNFNCPHGVTVDSHSNIYVADKYNTRVQVFDRQRHYVRTVGLTAQWGDDFNRLNSPSFTAVDAQDRLYIADTGNARIQVFDSTGAYLTTIGGDWGDYTGQFIDPGGIAIDRQGNVYIVDSSNHRIQKYAPGVTGWAQINLNGFGDRNNTGVWSFAAYNNRLYASAFNEASGAEVYRLTPDRTWERVATGGFGDSSNIAINRLVEFNGYLFAGTAVNDNSGAQIWRTPSGDPNSWSQVAQGGLGSPNNAEFTAMMVFDGYLYAASWVADSSVHGTEIWRSSTGDSGSWTRVVSNGFNNDANNNGIISIKTFNGALYAATSNGTDGGEVWRTSNGVNWVQVNANGFGSSSNVIVSSLGVFNSKLYAGTRHNSGGGEIWRTSNGTTWEPVMLGGFDNFDNRHIAALVPLQNELVVITRNSITGSEVWQSDSGDSGDWQKVMKNGFGSGRTGIVSWDNETIVFDNTLYVGTWTFGNGGGRIWKYFHNKTYLPILIVQ